MGLGIIRLAVLVVAGCLGTGWTESVRTGYRHLHVYPVVVEHVVVEHVVADESQNGATVNVNRTAGITLKLNENPTTVTRGI